MDGRVDGAFLGMYLVRQLPGEDGRGVFVSSYN